MPEEYGGGGMPVLARAIVWEELSRTIAIPARGEGITGPSARGILYSLTGEMKEKYLLPLLRGEKKACFAQTEPDAGSDPGGMRTTAVRDGDHYVINGVKRFITGAGHADFMQLMVATDRSKGSRGGISCFIVDMDTPGVKLGACYETMMGDKPWEIVLDNVRVPATHRVGEEGDGMRFGQQWLNIGRVKHGARALGVAERCLEMATSYAKQRSTFGRPLADRQAVQWMLADMYHRVAGRPPARLQDRGASRPGRRGARGRLRRQILSPTRWRSRPPTNACRSTAASRSRPIFRSRKCGGSSAATASPKARAR